MGLELVVPGLGRYSGRSKRKRPALQPSTDWTAAYPQWAARGLIPLRKTGEVFVDRTGRQKLAEGKEPLPPEWQSVHAQRAAVNEQWAETMHDMRGFVNEGRNIGLVIPDSCVVLDYDDPATVDKALQAFPDCPVQRTQSGGAHFWFRVNPGEQFTATTKVVIRGLKFDIRSGGRSQVVVSPSTGLLGSYIWLRPLPPDTSFLPLRPDELLAYQTQGGHKEVQRTNYGYMPAKPEKPKVEVYQKLQNVNPDLYEKIKGSLPLGRPGDRNNAMARAVGTILGVLTGAERPPHPELPFALLCRCIENDHTVGEDGGLPPTLAELWDICCRMSDRERPEWQSKRNILDGLASIRLAMRAKHEQTFESAREATAAACMVDEQQLKQQVLLLDMGGNYWVLDLDLKGYHGPLKAQAVLKYLHEKGASVVPAELFYNQQGKMRPVQELIRDCGQQVSRIWYDARVSVPVFNPRDGALVRPAWKLRDLQPEYDELIDQWLTRLNPALYHTLCDWLATLPLTSYPSSCLYLHGPTGTGKTLLVEGLSKLWESPPVPFRHAIADFNSGLLGSPLVYVEEGLSSDTDSMRFRDLLTTEVHDIRIKYEAPGELRGHVRMIVAANNPNALRIREDLTHADREAISRRILWLDTAPEAGYYLTAIGGRKTTEAWVAEGKLAKHILWLRDQRAQGVFERMDRLLVPGNSSSQKTRMLLTHRIPRSALRIVATTLQDYCFGKGTLKGLLQYADNTVECCWHSIHTVWITREHTYGKVPTADTGERALESLSSSASVRMVQGSPVKFYRIDRGVLMEELRAMYDETTMQQLEKFLTEACRTDPAKLN